MEFQKVLLVYQRFLVLKASNGDGIELNSLKDLSRQVIRTRNEKYKN